MGSGVVGADQCGGRRRAQCSGMITCRPHDLRGLLCPQGHVIAIDPSSGFDLKCDGCEPKGQVSHDRS